MDRPYPKLTVTEKAERALRAGHPWVYGDEIVSSAPCRDGEIAAQFKAGGLLSAAAWRLRIENRDVPVQRLSEELAPYFNP